MAKGDHIRVMRGLYWHHGIDCGDGTVIHFDGSPLRRRDATVACTSLARFAKGGRIELVNPCDSEEAESVVERALSRIGETDYDLVWNNCEHFANWCATGLSKSRQVEKVVKSVATAATVACVAVGLLRGITRRTLASDDGF